MNEEGNIEILVEKLVGIMGTYHEYDYEILFVDDGSTDGSLQKIKAIVESFFL
jgi:dolichol-phosphate mannosyltransferase